jgi:hypothetical protein
MNRRSQRLAVTAVGLALALTLVLPKTSGVTSVIVTVVALIAMAALGWELGAVARADRRDRDQK